MAHLEQDVRFGLGAAGARFAILTATIALLSVSAASAGPPAQEAPTATATPELPSDCQPQALLEAPTNDGVLRGVVTVGGWAVDLASPSGSGVTDVHVYLDGYGNTPGQTFIGRAEYGGVRVDVAQQFNDVRFARSAFNLSWDASTAGAGTHTLVVLYRTRCGWVPLAQTFEVDGPTIVLNIDTPPQGSPVNAPVRIEGWAADPRATQGTGVERVDLYLDGQITTEGIPLGEVSYGDSRTDVGAALGGQDNASRFTRSGWSMVWNPTGLSPGRHLLTFYARGPDGAVARSLALEVTAAGAGPRGATPVLPLPATMLPGAPAATPGRSGQSFGVAASNTTAGSVSLVWSPVPNAASYEVLVAEGVSVFSLLQTGLPDTRLVATNLNPGRSYRFVVRALDASGNEIAQSNTLSVTTSPAQPTLVATLTPTLRPSPTPNR